MSRRPANGDRRPTAVVMAGGKGTRLLPYTAVLPKPLMPVGDMPILELVLRQLHAHGVRDVVLAVNHLHHLIRSFFGDGSALGLDIEYAVEDRPLGTCGALAAIVERLSDDFILMNGDVLTDLDFARLLDSHRRSGASVTIASHERVFTIEFGVLQVSADGRVEQYVEKPQHRHRISMGIYAMSRSRVAPLLVRDVPMDVPDLIAALIAAGRPVADHATDALWLDIGNPADYARAQDIVAGQIERLIPGGRGAPGAR